MKCSVYRSQHRSTRQAVPSLTRQGFAGTRGTCSFTCFHLCMYLCELFHSNAAVVKRKLDYKTNVQNTKVPFYILFLCFSLPVHLDTFSRKFLCKRNCGLLHHCCCPTHTESPCITVVVLYLSWPRADLLSALIACSKLAQTQRKQTKTANLPGCLHMSGLSHFGEITLVSLLLSSEKL